MNWISVKDRLPKVHKYNSMGVAICRKGKKDSWPAFYSKEKGFHTNAGRSYCTVTDWQPLPKPPKK